MKKIEKWLRSNTAHHSAFWDIMKMVREKEKQGKATHKICPECGYKRWTNETLCPKCLEKDKDVFLERDYKAGKFRHIVKR